MLAFKSSCIDLICATASGLISHLIDDADNCGAELIGDTRCVDPGRDHTGVYSLGYPLLNVMPAPVVNMNDDLTHIGLRTDGLEPENVKRPDMIRCFEDELVMRVDGGIDSTDTKLAVRHPRQLTQPLLTDGAHHETQQPRFMPKPIAGEPAAVAGALADLF